MAKQRVESDVDDRYEYPESAEDQAPSKSDKANQPAEDEAQPFFETMPLTASPYTYQGTVDDTEDFFSDEEAEGRDGSKITAIVTVVLVAAVAAALAILFISGLDTIRSSSPGQTSSSGSLEL